MSNLPSLKAMAENKVDGVSKMTIFTVDPDVVEFEEGFNLREEGPDLDAHLEALYQAMKSGANVPPIDVSVIDGRVIARDGHCRTRTARRLKAEGVPYLLQARQFRGNEADCVFHMIGIYRMTGGQMAPTTLLGQKTSTSPYGRDFTYDGYPIRMAEMLATLEGSAFVSRVAVNNPANLMKAKRAIRKAFQMQIEEMGVSFVEILLACPTNWGLNALEANRRVEEEMIPYFPVGILKERKMADYL